MLLTDKCVCKYFILRSCGYGSVLRRLLKPSHVSSHDWANNSNNIRGEDRSDIRAFLSCKPCILWKWLFLCHITMIMCVIMFWTVKFAEHCSTGVFIYICFCMWYCCYHFCLFSEKVHWSIINITLYIKSTVVLPFLDKYHDTPNFIQEPYVNISVREVFGDMQFIKVPCYCHSTWFF